MRTGSRVGIALADGLALVVHATLMLAIVGASLLAIASATGTSPAGARPALAGKTTASWISLSTSTSRSAAIQPTLGSQVAFDTSYPTTVKNPRIEVLCYQGGSLVYGEAAGVNDTFVLGGGWSVWLEKGGAADCVANLYYFGFHAGKQTYNKLATTSFFAG